MDKLYKYLLIISSPLLVLGFIFVSPLYMIYAIVDRFASKVKYNELIESPDLIN